MFSLLDNLMNGLDRLYDKETRVIDIHALLHATRWAMAATDLGDQIGAAAEGVLVVVRSGATEEEQNRAALAVTDPLRRSVADAWAVGYAERYRQGGPS